MILTKPSTASAAFCLSPFFLQDDDQKEGDENGGHTYRRSLSDNRSAASPSAVLQTGPLFQGRLNRIKCLRIEDGHGQQIIDGLLRRLRGRNAVLELKNPVSIQVFHNLHLSHVIRALGGHIVDEDPNSIEDLVPHGPVSLPCPGQGQSS